MSAKPKKQPGGKYARLTRLLERLDRVPLDQLTIGTLRRAMELRERFTGGELALSVAALDLLEEVLDQLEDSGK